MCLQHVKRNDVKGALVGRLQIHRATHACVHRQQPCSSANAPGIARLQSRKIESGRGRDEVVTHVLSKLEKIVGQDATDGMRSTVAVVGVAASISVPAGEGRFRTGFECGAQDIHAGVHGSNEWYATYQRLFGQLRRLKPLLTRCHHVVLGDVSARPSNTSSSPARSRLSRSSKPPMLWPLMII